MELVTAGIDTVERGIALECWCTSRCEIMVLRDLYEQDFVDPRDEALHDEHPFELSFHPRHRRDRWRDRRRAIRACLSGETWLHGFVLDPGQCARLASFFGDRRHDPEWFAAPLSLPCRCRRMLFGERSGYCGLCLRVELGAAPAHDVAVSTTFQPGARLPRRVGQAWQCLRGKPWHHTIYLDRDQAGQLGEFIHWASRELGGA